MKKTIYKVIAVTTAISLLIQCVVPGHLYAMNQQSSPEFSSFEPIGSADMVNDFTGSFTYNIPVIEIPGPDGGGYALNLSYSSDLSPEADASWVGYGWTMSPGAIVRNKQGFADDVNEGSVIKYNKAPSDLTASVSGSLALEVFALDILTSGDDDETASVGAGLTATARYNSYNGLTVSAGISATLSGYGLSLSNNVSSTGDHSFDASFSPGEFVNDVGKTATTTMLQSEFEKSSFYKNMDNWKGFSSSQYCGYSLGNQSRPTYVSGYDGFSFSLSVSGEAGALPAHIGLGGTLTGGVSMHFPINSETMSYYGYIYSHNAPRDEDGTFEMGDNNVLMDYSIEKESAYNERDYYLGIPYSAADHFVVMGEGIGGSFRAYSKTPGHFRANTRSSYTAGLNAGFDAMIGITNGAGGRIDASFQALTSNEWYHGDDFLFTNDGDEPYYFQFNGDMGSSVDYGGTDAVAFSMNGGEEDGYAPVAPSDLYAQPNNSDERVERSSYIGYHTIADIEKTDDNGKNYKRYNQRTDIETLADRSSANDSQIGEFSVTNANGAHYLYALPVYVKEEKNVSFTIEPEVGNYIVHPTVDINDASDNIDVASDVTSLVGEEMASGEKYANTWLLTQITTPDFIDVDNNGPSDLDFGGWTLFNYTKVWGENNTSGNDDWYKYRSPFTGCFNSPNRISDGQDDMGSYSSGKKEMYYVESIETKTHKAVFTLSDRTDGFDAHEDDDEAISNENAMGDHAMKQLDKIELYAKESNELIQTVYFEYDNSAFNGQLNSYDGTGTKGDPSNRTGKLTLKRVYTEYANVKNSKVSPYVFYYEYPAAASFPAPYESINDFYSSSLNQTPDYNALDIDRWAYYQQDGESRYAVMNPWLDQTPPTDFDPAAYMLKQIDLPSGGEIHIQYEQNEYLYVQDKKAMAMVSISSVDRGNSSYDGQEDNEYQLHLSELGIDTQEEVDALKEQLDDQYMQSNPERMYFKFLFSLKDNTDGTLGGGNCAMDWIDGYVKVKNVRQDGLDIYIKLGDPDESSEAYDVPREVCVDFYNQTRAGKIDVSAGSCDAGDLSQPLDDGSDSEDFIYQFVEFIDDAASVIGLGSICGYIDETNSYFRIPLPDTNPKKGGGVRVKRIITYDGGLEGDGSDAIVSGQEYIYLTTDSTSSGVATYEPGLGKEENAMVGYLDKRKDSDWAQRIVSGRDKEQFEGPIGEYIMPSPSIGYSRVVTRGLYSGYTHTPLIIKEFNTCKDYPVEVSHTTMDKKDLWIPIPTYPISTNITKVWATQGYSCILNGMHGQLKREASYSGDYTNIASNLQLVTEKVYSYLQPGESVKSISSWNWVDGEDLSNVQMYENIVPGQHTEVVIESREVVNVSVSAAVEFDVSVATVPPILIPYIPVMPYLNYIEDNLRTHVTHKITFFPAVLDSITVTKDGITTTTKNEYNNKCTGTPIVTSVKDGYNDLELMGSNHDGTYYSIDFPASHQYTNMAAKSTNEQLYIESSSSLSISKLVNDNDGDGRGDEFYLSLAGSGICDNLDYFSQGSLIAIYTTSDRTNPDIYNIGEINGGLIELLPTNYFYYDYSTSSPAGVSVEIIRSGKSNQLNASVGSITSYGGLPTATINEISSTLIEAREILAEELNAQLDGSSVSLSADELADLSSLGIINPATGNCEEFSTVFSGTYGTTKSSGSGSGSSAGYGIGLSSSNQTYYYTALVCKTIPMRVHCDTVIGGSQDGPLVGYSKPYVVCDTIPARDTCHYEKRSYEHSTLTVVVISPEGSDGLDNDGDGLIDETDEGEECTMELNYVEDYEFYVDDETGDIMYGIETNDCDAVAIECIDLCPNEYASVSLDKIVAATAVSLSDDWTYGNYIADAYNVSSSDNIYETGEKGKWRLLSSYGYSTTASTITDANTYAYNTGIFDDFTLFNYDYIDANDHDKWILSNTIEYYSPNGIALQENNLLDVKSAAKYGYDGNALPYLIAANAEYSNLFFESFENGSDIGTDLFFEDNYSISKRVTYSTYGGFGEWSATEAHSGSKSYKLGFVDDPSTATKTDYKSQLSLDEIALTNAVREEGLLVKVWIKNSALSNDIDDIKLIVDGPMSTISQDFEKVARVGEWELYSAQTGEFSSSYYWGSTITPAIYMNQGNSNNNIYIDDVRVQPLNAQVSSYVYDVDNLRLLTQFDDQLFGLYYQYNNEGKLIRKLTETERGMKTIVETQYHMPTVTK